MFSPQKLMWWSFCYVWVHQVNTLYTIRGFYTVAQLQLSNTEKKGRGREEGRNKQAKTGTNHVQNYLTKHECPEYIMNIYNLIVERLTTWQNIGKRVEQILQRGIFNIYKWPKNTSSLVNREMQIKTAGRYTIGLKTNNTKCCQGWELLVNLNDTSTLGGDMEVSNKTEHHWKKKKNPSHNWGRICSL